MTTTRWQVRRVAETASTNDDALALARAGASHGTVVLADTQTHGRGQKGRVWHSPPHTNVYLSVILRPALPPAAAPPLTLVAGVAVCDTVNLFAPPASIKWPNDILIRGRKVAGILTESSTRGNHLEAVVVGVGVNVNLTALPPDLHTVATSIAIERGAPIDRDAFVERLLGSLEHWFDRHAAAGPTAITQAWRQRAILLGQRVRVAEGAGRARDIDDDGALCVELDDGRLVRVRSGEVTA